MSNQNPLGTLPSAEAERDAVHVAIISVVARDDVYPGQKLCLLASDGPQPVVKVYTVEGNHDMLTGAVGVVDPFLSSMVPKGKPFYLCLNPNTVTGMRHHWQHPAFKDEAKQSIGQQQLQLMADDLGISFGALITSLENNNLHVGSREFWNDRVDDIAQWYREWKGQPLPDDELFFRCGC